MTVKHTPGPWSIHSDGDCIVSEVPNPHSNLNPVICFIDEGTPNAADAALIAAAPDLLAAAEAAAIDAVGILEIESASPEVRKVVVGMLVVLNTTIAKARGE